VTGLRRANLILAVLATLVPIAHVLELPNKLALDGPLWLGVQQHLYRGWGPFLGGPVEIGALLTSLALLALHRRTDRNLWPMLLAAVCYAGMIIVFFVFNTPVNAAVSNWTGATLPTDWPSFRLRWEIGHAAAALLSLVALAALIRFYAGERAARS
jgi:hypothetical protein